MKANRPDASGPFSAVLAASAPPAVLKKPVPWLEGGEIIPMPPLLLQPSAPRENAATDSYLKLMGIRSREQAPHSGREKEIKLALEGVDEMSRLAGALGDCVGELRQFNLFYEDLAEQWRRAKFSVRFRLENDQLELTIKGKGTRENGISDLIEESMPLDPSLWRGLCSGDDSVADLVRRLLNERKLTLPEGLNPDELVVLGGFTNTRRVYSLPGDSAHRVELDLSTFPNGVVSHEVEMEFSRGAGTSVERASAALKTAFARAGVEWRPSDLPKMARLRGALNGTDPQ